MTRILFRVVGLVSIAAGTYALAKFTPPTNADPGGVNLCREVFMALILVGLDQLVIARALAK